MKKTAKGVEVSGLKFKLVDSDLYEGYGIELFLSPVDESGFIRWKGSTTNVVSKHLSEKVIWFNKSAGPPFNSKIGVPTPEEALSELLGSALTVATFEARATQRKVVALRRAMRNLRQNHVSRS